MTESKTRSASMRIQSMAPSLPEMYPSRVHATESLSLRMLER